MAFRYINPGYVSLLDVDSGATEITGTSYSKSGVAFYLSDADYNKGLTLENFSFEKDFWIMFDFYIGSSDNSSHIYVYAPGGKKVGVWIRNSPSWGIPNVTIYACWSGNTDILADAKGSDTIKDDLGITVNSVNTALMHVKYGEAGTGYIEIFINNRKNWKYSGYAIGYTSSNKKVVFYCPSPAAISNLIISDEEISPKERVIALPTSATATDMTAGTDGIYIADAANQTLLQTPDVTALIEEYGANSAVTGISVFGNPAYRTGTGIMTLTGLSKSGGVISEHDSCVLSEETLGTAMSGWTLQNTTIADLQSMQFGWKAGE